MRPAVRPGADEGDQASARSTAIFDEGVSTDGGWLDLALANGYEIIAIEPAIVKKLEALGYSRAMLPKKRYKQLKEDALTIDYSGWALVTHKWLPNRVAYAAIETIDETKKNHSRRRRPAAQYERILPWHGKMSAARAAPSGRGAILQEKGISVRYVA